MSVQTLPTSGSIGWSVCLINGRSGLSPKSCLENVVVVVVVGAVD